LRQVSGEQRAALTYPMPEVPSTARFGSQTASTRWPKGSIVRAVDTALPSSAQLLYLCCTCQATGMVGVIELLRSNDPVLMSFVTSLLTDANIEHDIADAHMSVIEGSIGALPSRILVADAQHGDALRLLADANIPIDAPRR
jgi:hypothetical protein